MKNLKSISHALCGAVALLVALQGCGDDDGDNPTPPKDVTPTAGSKNTGGSGGKSGGNAAGSSDGGTDSNGTGNTGNTGTGNTGNRGNDGDGGNDAVAGNGQGGDPNIPTPRCDLPELGENGCFNCPEDRKQEQWFNRCADGDCVDFDDSKLVKLGGDRHAPLPDLPN